MNSNSKFLIKNIGILTLSNFASKLLIIILLPLYTNILSTKDVGIYDLIVSSVSLLSPVLSLNISESVLRYSLDEYYDSDKVISIGLKYILFSYFIFILFVSINSFFNICGLFYGYEIWFVLYYVFSLLHTFLINTIKGRESIKLLGLGSFINTFLVLTLNIVFLVVFKLGLNGFFVSYIVSFAITCIIYIYSTKLYNSVSLKIIDKNLRNVMIKYSVPLIVTSIGWWVNSTADKFFVSAICGIASNGLLAVAYKIPSIINVLQSVFLQAWQVSAVKEYKTFNSNNFYINCYSFLSGLLFIFGALLIVLNRAFAFILFAKEFYDAWHYVPFLLISIIINTLSGYFGSILSAKQNTSVLAKSAIIGTIINLVFNYFLINLIGIQGATIATLISSIFIFLVRYCGIIEIISINFILSNLNNILLLIIQAIVSIFGYGIQYEVLLFFLVLVLNVKSISKIMSIFKYIILRK